MIVYFYTGSVGHMGEAGSEEHENRVARLFWPDMVIVYTKGVKKCRTHLPEGKNRQDGHS